MAYGDYSGPDKATKGQEGGACNRQRCQAEPALWWNHGSHSWYCADCARDIGEDHVNKRHWTAEFPRYFPGESLFPMLETREEMDARSAPQIASIPARQQGKTVMVTGARLSYDPIQKPEDAGEERRWSVTTQLPRESRQVRRARERSFYKRLPRY